MNRKDIVEKIWQKNPLMLRGEIEAVVTQTISIIKTAVKKGDEVTFIGFGRFYKKVRKARLGVNPSTGERIKIKSRIVAKFRPGKAFSDSLN